MILNRIDIGTQCTVRETGAQGTLKKIYFYPTKYEIEFSNGQIEHYHSKDIKFDGVDQKQASLNIPTVPEKGIGECWTNWIPFKGESLVNHHFSTTKEIAWEVLTSLEMYNVWFYGIQRAHPVTTGDRYVHQYSFTQLEIKPGSRFKIRPKTVAPYFDCRIMTLEKNKKFGFTFRTSPFLEEYVQFNIKETDIGVWVSCRRKSKGIFSIISQLNWQKKARILQDLDLIIPKVDFTNKDEALEDGTDEKNQFGGFNSKQDYIDYAINMGLEGNMDFVNSIQEKPIRGMAKAGMVKAKRTGKTPAKPEKSEAGLETKTTDGLSSLSNDDMVAFLVNKGLDGDMDSVNNHDNKIIRGKAKAFIVKIKRGSLERPSMPEVPEPSESVDTKAEETDEQLIERLLAKGLDGDMDEINALDNRVLRGKIKAAIVKAKRAAK